MRSVNPLAILLIGTIFLCMFVFYTSSLSSYSSRASNIRNDQDIRYGVICDAGSSGTRIFVYKFSRKSAHDMINIDTLIRNNVPIVKKVSPGLSTFGDNISGVIDYFAPLLQFAEENIPDDLIEHTDLLIFATAGMRLLSERSRNDIIYELRKNLSRITKLRVIESNIQVIDGNWEGIYSWIAVNYVLGKFSLKREESVGMIDMGGASVQIAFELPANESFANRNVFNLNLGPSDSSNAFKYKIFATTFLGYGANEGLRKFENSLVNTANSSSEYLDDACSPPGMIKTVNHPVNGPISLKGNGQWDMCVSKIQQLMDIEKNELCDRKTCYLKNTLAPDVNLSKIPLYGFSEYWYTTKNFRSDGPYYFDKLSKNARDFCSKSWSSIQEGVRRNEFPEIDLDRLETNCFKAAWVTSVLHDGFNVNRNSNKFQSVYQISGEEIQWALGAMIYHFRRYSFKKGTNSAIDHEKSEYFIKLSFVAVVVLFILLKTQVRSAKRKRLDSNPFFV